MADLKRDWDAAENERDKLQQERKQAWQRMLSLFPQVKAVVQYAEKELAEAEAARPSSNKQQRVLMAMLRLEGAQNNLQLLKMLEEEVFGDTALTPAVAQRFDQILAKTQFISIEFNLVRFEPILAAIEEVLNAPVPTPSDVETAVQTPVPQVSAPGAMGRAVIPPPRPPLGAARGPVVPPARSGQGTGPLPPRPAGSTVRPSPVVRAPAGPRAPQRNTGLLPGKPGLPVRPGTQRLTNENNLTEQLVNDLKASATSEEFTKQLRLLRDRVLDLQAGAARVRGEAPGVLASERDALTAVRQLAGQAYHVGRAVVGLTGFERRLAFESPEDDPSLSRFLSTLQQKEATPEGVKPDASESLAKRLKNLFNT